MRKRESSAGLIPSPLASFLILSLLWACGGGGDDGAQSVPTPPVTGAVSVTLSDPPACLVPNGPFQNVWVTLTRVRVHASGTAGPNDSGWVDLVDLRSSPVQIDLLSLQSPACILSQLGSRSGIASGQYQQIRLHLLTNSPDSTVAVPAANVCSGSGYNCVILASGGIQTLLLTSEAEVGDQDPLRADLRGRVHGNGRPDHVPQYRF